MTDATHIFCSRFLGPNPLAPPWMFSSDLTSDTPAGYEDLYHEYTLKVVLANGATSDGNVVLFDGDSSFIWETMSQICTPGNGNATAIRFVDPSGRYMSGSRLLLVSLADRGEQCTPLVPPIVVPPGGQILVDLKETAGNQGNTVNFSFQGRKRRLQNNGGPGDWWKQMQHTVPGRNSAKLQAPAIAAPGLQPGPAGGAIATSSSNAGDGSGAL